MGAGPSPVEHATLLGHTHLVFLRLTVESITGLRDLFPLPRNVFRIPDSEEAAGQGVYRLEVVLNRLLHLRSNVVQRPQPDDLWRWVRQLTPHLLCDILQDFLFDFGRVQALYYPRASVGLLELFDTRKHLLERAVCALR